MKTTEKQLDRSTVIDYAYTLVSQCRISHMKFLEICKMEDPQEAFDLLQIIKGSR